MPRSGLQKPGAAYKKSEEPKKSTIQKNQQNQIAAQLQWAFY